MIDHARSELYSNAIKAYGVGAQSMQAIEEMAELTHALIRNMHRNGSAADVVGVLLIAIAVIAYKTGYRHGRRKEREAWRELDVDKPPTHTRRKKHGRANRY